MNLMRYHNRCSLLTIPVIASLVISLIVSPEFAQAPNSFVGNRAMTMPNGSAAWLSIEEHADIMAATLWTVGAVKAIADLPWSDQILALNV